MNQMEDVLAKMPERERDLIREAYREHAMAYERISLSDLLTFIEGWEACKRAFTPTGMITPPP